MSTPRCEFITKHIRTVLPDADITVRDPHHDDTHFEALVISDQFNGLSRIKRHQLVMKPLRDAIESNTIHALALMTYTPAEWAAK